MYFFNNCKRFEDLKVNFDFLNRTTLVILCKEISCNTHTYIHARARANIFFFPTIRYFDDRVV